MMTIITNTFLIIDLLRYIHSFLNAKDYLTLMNCSRKLFSMVKKETIHYSIIIDVLSSEAICNGFKSLSLMIDQVNTPSKQITLTILKFPMYFNVPSVVSQLHTLILATGLESDNFSYLDFNIFNNIPVVTLIDFPGVTRITSGLKNIQKLTLQLYHIEEVYDLNTSDCLSEFTLMRGCLRELPITSNFNDAYKKIYANKVARDFRHAKFVRTKEGACFELVSLVMRVTSRFNDETDDEHKADDDYSGIPELSLSFSSPGRERADKKYNYDADWSDDEEERPILPVFQGRKLKLIYLDISDWYWSRDISLSCLQDLHLERCIGPSHFPSMPRLKRLYLNEVDSFDNLRTFPNLTYLVVIQMLYLCEIQPQPMLRHLELTCCPNVKNLHSSFDGQVFQYVALDTDCSAVYNIGWARNAFSLKLGFFTREPSLVGYENTTLVPAEKKEISFSGVVLPDLSFVSNFKKVHIRSCNSFRSDDKKYQLSNISDLTICSCDNFHSGKNLSSIQRLLIMNCQNLTSLHHFENIPLIALCVLPKFNGLADFGAHDHVYLGYVQSLECAARAFASYKSESISIPLRLSHFQNVKACTIIELPLAFYFDWTKLSANEHERLW